MKIGPLITGIGIVSPLGIGKEKFWNALVSGSCAISPIKSPDISRYRFRKAAHLREGDLGDDDPSSTSRRNARFALLASTSARLALSDANVSLQRYRGRVAVVVGTTHGPAEYCHDFYRYLIDHGPETVSPLLFSEGVLNAASASISIRQKIDGGAVTIVGDENGGLDAIGYASTLVRSGVYDMVVCGGANEFHKSLTIAYEQLGLLSPGRGGEEHMSPYGESRNGFIIGEGAAIVVVESAQSAESRGAHAYAEIRGWSSSFGGDVIEEAKTGKTLSALFAQSLASAAISPRDIGVVIGCGNSSDIDDIEIMAVRNLRSANGEPLLTSIKGATGESFAAASALQVAVGALAVETSCIPPTIGVQRPVVDFVPARSRKRDIGAALISSFSRVGKYSAMVLGKVGNEADKG